jgi:L-cysteine:1D-myo-inositol 2-amino-2-deoxy-alpha-D-glucopyranoside ligase
VRGWDEVEVPRLPGTGDRPRVRDTASGALVDPVDGDTARLYVCGVTPYDAAHLGHAATYLAFDTLVRAWRDSGVAVRYAQNTTDVDDPLLERARDRHLDWRELAAGETAAFRRDMAALRLVPPDVLAPVTEHVDAIADAVGRLLDGGTAYRLGGDVYFDGAAAEERTDWRLGAGSGLDRGRMAALSAERGGDPDRVGKHDPLDPALWRAPAGDDPHWPSSVGEGRPGWHIECTVLAEELVGLPLSVQGGATDLVFPHHEYSAGHAAALYGRPLATATVHAGLMSYAGAKMSKSLGNLVFVRELLDGGTDPRALRLALLAHRYSDERDWDAGALAAGEARLARWIAGAAAGPTGEGDERLLLGLREALADDLDTPTALRLVDEAADLAGLGPLAVDAIDALLGVRL